MDCSLRGHVLVAMPSPSGQHVSQVWESVGGGGPHALPNGLILLRGGITHIGDGWGRHHMRLKGGLKWGGYCTREHGTYTQYNCKYIANLGQTCQAGRETVWTDPSEEYVGGFVP